MVCMGAGVVGRRSWRSQKKRVFSGLKWKLVVQKVPICSWNCRRQSQQCSKLKPASSGVKKAQKSFEKSKKSFCKSKQTTDRPTYGPTPFRKYRPITSSFHQTFRYFQHQVSNHALVNSSSQPGLENCLPAISRPAIKVRKSFCQNLSGALQSVPTRDTCTVNWSEWQLRDVKSQ